MAFTSKPLRPAAWLQTLRARPFLLFGLPFLSLMVVSSFALQNLTRTRYDYHAQKSSTLSVEEGLGMRADRKRVDIREEYYRLNAPQLSNELDKRLDAGTDGGNTIPAKRPKFSMAPVANDSYEPVRVPRPAGMPEWGPGKGEDEAPLKGSRKEDRWV